ncbi:orotate phosphoribosyltransferase, partial [Oleoguttula sp. CCFEE 5521]
QQLNINISTHRLLIPNPTMASSPPPPPWKSSLISLCLSSNILTFGTFTLKSGRQSPYFFNCGLFSRARLIRAISSAYAKALDTYAQEHSEDDGGKGWGFDVLFGPAYKGIPLAATTVEKLAGIDEQRWGEVGYAFNRKEVKDHGEGGLMVGESLKGKRVVVIDDVMTAGTAIQEALSIIKAQGGTLVGIIVAVNRQERMVTLAEREGREEDRGEKGGSAIGAVRKQTGVPVLAVLTLTDIIEGMRGMGRESEVRLMEGYYEKYGTED